MLDAAGSPCRSPDPSIRSDAGCVIRRVAPDARKIDLGDLKNRGLTEDLLTAMAADVAAVHAASRKAGRIARDLEARPQRRLQQAVEAARNATERDFAAYRAMAK